MKRLRGTIMELTGKLSRASVLCVAIGGLSGCAAGSSSPPAEAQADQRVPGWVRVDFGLTQDYVEENRGELDQEYDEFVGGLLDRGLTTDEATWLKPTYGNRNILWTLGPGIGGARQQALRESRDAFPENAYEFGGGTVLIGGSEWTYYGYAQGSRSTDAGAFRSVVFVCEGRPGVSLFYWGEGSATPPQNDEAVRAVLKAVSERCE